MTEHTAGRLVAASRPIDALAGRTRVADPAAVVPARPSSPGIRSRRPPARLVIVGWVLVLMFGVLAMVNIASRQALLVQVDEQVTAVLAEHAEEFALFAALGVDPDTARPFTDVGVLLADHLQRHSPDDDDILFGYVDEITGGASGGRIRQAGEPPFDVSADVPLRSAILAAPAATGSIDTPAGELRWEKRRVSTAPDAAVPSTGWFVAGLFIDRERADVFGSMRTLLLYSALGLVLAGFGAWLVSGRILAPVRMMRSVAAEITERDLTRRIEVDGNDEMAALAVQFNSMLDRLQEAFVAQNRFVDAAAHELRTPLTVIRGNLEMLELEELGNDPAERTAMIADATEEIDRMSRIVADLIVLSRAQRPDFLRTRPVSVADLTCDLGEAASGLTSSGQGPRRWVVADIGEATVDADPNRLLPALLQLARNAVQHTNEGDEIRLGSVTGEHTVTFWIADSGPGIPPGVESTIFDRFVRDGLAGARVEGTGAGLGLAVVRAVAEAHGGSVAVRPGSSASAAGAGSSASAAGAVPRSGVTFTVELPRR